MHSEQNSTKDLSPRELEVAKYISLGKANKEIAGILGISERTVKKHVTHALEKLGMDNRVQIGIYVVQNPIMFDTYESSSIGFERFDILELPHEVSIFYGQCLDRLRGQIENFRSMPEQKKFEKQYIAFVNHTKMMGYNLTENDKRYLDNLQKTHPNGNAKN